MFRIPKAIIPADALTFERLLPKLDKFTELGKGVIRAVIDYYMWESYIEIYLKHLEFCTEEDFLLLQDISRSTNSFTVYSTEDGGIRLWILIHYFDEIYELMKMSFDYIETVIESWKGTITPASCALYIVSTATP